MSETWRGFAVQRWEDAGRSVTVVSPRKPAARRPWVWRAEFHEHEPQLDLAFLERGFHYVYADLSNLYGGPEAMQRMDRVYERVTQTLQLSSRVALEGLSRGGLFVYRWASRWPQRVACIYADNPVCDIKSWPAGKGSGPGSAEDWRRLMSVYGFTSEAEAVAYRGNPVDVLQPLAAAAVPLLHVCGDADEVVPYDENTAVLRDRYRPLGGHIDEIIKPGSKHHPHALPDPAPLVAFIERAYGGDRGGGRSAPEA